MEEFELSFENLEIESIESFEDDFDSSINQFDKTSDFEIINEVEQEFLHSAQQIWNRVYSEITPLPQVCNDEIQELSTLVWTDAIVQFIFPKSNQHCIAFILRQNLNYQKQLRRSLFLITSQKTLDQKERVLLFDTKDVNRIIAFCSMSGLKYNTICI
ncbi:unnamed protein product [Brachionus calyciflorus]|uniref:Uncharacterized protein n=1 Tax=Brachionus calyciflorus TaxID=104777 RepID=A0A813Z3I1_9BILA|nr:unnamed protein product [Brachionus calyciflorus]